MIAWAATQVIGAGECDGSPIWKGANLTSCPEANEPKKTTSADPANTRILLEMP